MSNHPTAVVPTPSAPTWQNWSGNLVHSPATDGVMYYFMPTNLTELQSVLAEAAKVKGATVRVSGQRHSQSPLVVDDNRGNVPQTTTSYLVDMSCYKDLGPNHDQSILLGPGENQVTVNAGVREDELDAFLIKHNLMLKTVTAGGFFSLGGMTAVDVHGATQDAPIFAETVSAFNIVLADGTVKTINQQSPAIDGWSPLQFARVSLGGLGIVTSVTIDVMERKFATTLQGGVKTYRITDKSAFISEFQPLLNHARLETFFTPYAAKWPGQDTHWALWWDVVNDPTPETSNKPPDPYPPTACKLASQPQPTFGAPDMGFIEGFSQALARAAQSAYIPEDAAIIAKIALDVIEKQVVAANASHSELWLAEAARVIFMSYYVPLPDPKVPDYKAKALGIVWKGLDAVSQKVTKYGNFHIAAPMEFRFVKGGNSAMSGTYSENPDAWFVNLDIIGFVDAEQKASGYPPKLLKFFADVERAWVKLGGFTHQGKMYGFYDPTKPEGTYSETGPFNPNFLANLRTRRNALPGAPLQAFNTYRKSLDPNGLFYNEFLRKLLEG